MRESRRTGCGPRCCSKLSAARPDAFEAAAAPFGSLLASLLPGPQAGTGARSGLDPDGSQSPFRTHDALCEVLLALAAQRPLVLLLEDVHWADAVSLDLLRLLAARRQGHPLSIVLTGWDLEAWPDASRFRVMTEILKGPDAEILRLAGLARTDVATLVDAHAGPGVDERVIDALHRQSTGSPYFVLQMLSLLCDARDLREPGATDEILTLIVTCTRKVLRQEFAMLPEPLLRLLRLCAVVAPDIDLDTVCRATGCNSAIAIVESAIRYGLLAPDRQRAGRLRLVPLQAQEVLIGELTDEERQRLHARYADALSPHGQVGSDPEDIDRVAHHAWLARDVMPAERVLPWLLRAAENAELRLASEDREMWLRRAVGTAGSLPDGTTARDLEQRLHLELGHVLGQVRGFGDVEAEEEIARGHAPRTTPHTPDDPAVLSMLAMSLLVRGCYDESRQLSGLLRNIAERTDGPTARLGAAYGEGMTLFVHGHLPDALEELERGAELAERLACEGRLPDAIYRSDPRVYFRCYCVFARWLLNDRAAAAEQRRLPAAADEVRQQAVGPGAGSLRRRGRGRLGRRRGDSADVRDRGRRAGRRARAVLLEGDAPSAAGLGPHVHRPPGGDLRHAQLAGRTAAVQNEHTSSAASGAAGPGSAPRRTAGGRCGHPAHHGRGGRAPARVRVPQLRAACHAPAARASGPG